MSRTDADASAAEPEEGQEEDHHPLPSQQDDHKNKNSGGKNTTLYQNHHRQKNQSSKHSQDQTHDRTPSRTIESSSSSNNSIVSNNNNSNSNSNSRKRNRRWLDFARIQPPIFETDLSTSAAAATAGTATGASSSSSSFVSGKTKTTTKTKTTATRTSTSDVGRHNQMKILLGLYREAVEESHASAIVLIAKSGTGKSVFLASFVQQIRQLYDEEQQQQQRQQQQQESKEDEEGDENTERDSFLLDDIDVWATTTSEQRFLQHDVHYDSNSSSRRLRPLLVGLGKFEEQTAASEPFEAIVHVVDSVLNDLIPTPTAATTSDNQSQQPQSDNDCLQQRQAWIYRLKESLEDDELTILKRHLPNLAKLLSPPPPPSTAKSSSSSYDTAAGSDEKSNDFDNEDDRYEDDDDENPFGDMSTREYRFQRFRLAFRELIRCISRVVPLVMVLDDLHFADKDSVQLIKTIVDDTVRSKELKLLFVGASRPVGDVSIDSRHHHSDDNMNTMEESHKSTASSALFNPNKIWGGRLAPIKSLLSGRADTPPSQTDEEAVKCVVRSVPTSGVRKIILPGLSALDIESMIRKLIAVDPIEEGVDNNGIEDLADLASVVHKKTDGNAFVVVYVLRQLEKRELLYYDESVGSWKWKLRRITEEIDPTKCVRGMIVDELRALDRRQREVLITAACFGLSHFELSTIVHAMDVVNDQMVLQESINEEDLSSMLTWLDVEGDYTDHVTIRGSIEKTKTILDKSVENGFVHEISPAVLNSVMIGSGRLHIHFFQPEENGHRSIYGLRDSLLPSGRERKQVHLRIARQLRRWMDTEEETGVCLSSDMVVLHAAKQYNFGQALITDQWERLDVAELNFQAAEVAARKASFATSSYYMYSGLSVLGENAWTDYYDLTLKMTTAYTRAQFSCGEFDECISSADEVISYGKEWSHKRDMYHTKMLCLLQQKRIDEGLKLGRYIMDILGHPLPKRFLELHLIRDFLKVNSFFKDMTDDEIRNIPEFEDENYVEAMAVLARMMEFSFYGGPEIYFDAFAIRAYLTMKEKGSHPSITPYGIGGWGWVLCVDGKFSEAARFANLGLELNEKLCTGKYRGIALRCKIVTFYYFFGWKDPLSTLTEPISNALTEMCTVGALDLYHQDVATLLRHGFVSGLPLEKLAKTCHKVLESLNDYTQPVFWNTSAPVAQAVLNLMGRSKNPAVLAGAYIDPDVSVDDWEDSNKAVLNQYHLFSMIVKYHFGDYSDAKNDMKQLNKSLWDDGPEFLVASRVLYTGLLNIQLFRETRKGKYRRRAASQAKQLSRWVQNGASNCLYQKLLLEAELASVQSTNCFGSRKTTTVVAAASDGKSTATTRTRFSPSSVSDIVLLYNKSIDAASNAGVRHHEALANELASNFLDEMVGSKNLAARYFSRSVTLYKSWQAYGKVDDLIRHHPDLRELYRQQHQEYCTGLKRFDRTSHSSSV
eukprot:CAMPEP_0113505480 /NCGR_PEP_ID=MMETSP0014_2-20120614/35344_1 /TAXON_ID=2857 /ORGANISM="Nitzschia sp." /LENGTH=1456 /DNA_ID=CAMNT_0000400805 /DNA_START=187 /DNA_END=4558 /DNA_ORIENTATION=- /assembly_acc=CAM_ASM_000159